MTTDSTKSIVLVAQELQSFDKGRFFHSITSMENFFEALEGSLPYLPDDELTQLFGMVDFLGKRAWFARCLIIAEMKKRTEAILGHVLSEDELRNTVKPLEISRTTAYDDLQIYNALRKDGVEPRLDRNFYKVALRHPNFKEAIEYAEQQYDAFQGKYTALEFKKWVDSQILANTPAKAVKDWNGVRWDGNQKIKDLLSKCPGEMNKTRTEWCEYSWNPMSDKEKPTFYPERLGQPLKVKYPSTVLVCDVVDLFNHDFTTEEIKQVIEIARYSPHLFIFITENPRRYLDFEFSKNCWLGIRLTDSLEAQEKIDFLKRKFNYRFIDFSPLQGDVSGLNFEGVDWILIGGSSEGLTEESWVRGIKHKNILYKNSP